MVHPSFNNSINNSSFTINHSFTFADGKYSCIEWVYYLHIACAYLLVVTGILAITSRVWTALGPYHVWFGRAFMIIMYWAMGTSLLIHNTGLPMPIIVFFIFMLTSLSIGWIAIKVHSINMEKQALLNVSTPKSTDGINLQQMINNEKVKIAANKTFTERLFSWKALHGFMMSVAWFQMAGRTMVTNPDPAPGCWTYPAFKASYEGEQAFFVPSKAAQPIAFGSDLIFIAVTVVPWLIGFPVVGIIYSWVASRKSKSESFLLK